MALVVLVIALGGGGLPPRTQAQRAAAPAAAGARYTIVATDASKLAEALAINAEAWTRALKTGFLALSGLALLAIFPCSLLPAHKPGEIPSEPPNKAERGQWIAGGVDVEL